MNAYQSYLVRCNKNKRFPMEEQAFVDLLEEAYAYQKTLWLRIENARNGGSGMLTLSIPHHTGRLLDKIEELDKKLGY